MRNLYHKIPAIVYTVFIFYLSSLPGDEVPSIGIANFDKIGHIIEYAIYGFLLMLAFSRSRTKNISEKAIILSIVFGSVYAATDEIHQLFVLTRTASIFDYFADTFGVMLGVFIYSRALFLKKRMINVFNQTQD